MANKSIEIIELSKRPYKGHTYSKLILQIRGTDAIPSTINGLRRAVYREVPTYALAPQAMTIEANDSVFNTDRMKLRLAQLPLFGLSNDITFLPRRFWYEVDYSDSKRDKHENDNINFEIYISAHNDTAINMDVTTDSVKFYHGGEQIQNIYKHIAPILIVQLKPNQAFKARCKAVLGIGERDDIWASASNCYYKEVGTRDYKFTMEGRGIMDEYEALIKSCCIIKKKLQDIKTTIGNEFKGSNYNTDKILEITLKNEDHTIGEIINEGIQNHPDILYAGISKRDLNIKEIDE